MNFSLQDALRAAFFGEVGGRSVFYSVYKHAVSLRKWQLRWACNLLETPDEMIRKGSVPWVRGEGVLTFSAWWSPKLWYSWPAIDDINRAAARSPDMGRGIPACESILTRTIRQRIVDRLCQVLPRIPEAREVNLARFRATLGPLLDSRRNPIVLLLEEVTPDPLPMYQEIAQEAFREIFQTDEYDIPAGRLPPAMEARVHEVGMWGQSPGHKTRRAQLPAPQMRELRATLPPEVAKPHPPAP